jgi:hypothetical protein
MYDRSEPMLEGPEGTYVGRGGNLKGPDDVYEGRDGIFKGLGGSYDDGPDWAYEEDSDGLYKGSYNGVD